MHAANNLFSISDAQIWLDIYFIIFVEINGSQTNFSKLRWMWLLLLHASLVIKKLPLILLMLTMDCYKILQISWEVHHCNSSASFATSNPGRCPPMLSCWLIWEDGNNRPGIEKDISVVLIDKIVILAGLLWLERLKRAIWTLYWTPTSIFYLT